MPLFALVYQYVEDSDFVALHRPAHRAYLRQLCDAGELVLAGPLGDPGTPSGLLIFDVMSAERVEALADDDPFQISGVIRERSVRSWALSIGQDLFEPAATRSITHPSTPGT